MWAISRCVGRLIQNIRLNNFEDRVEVISAACSDSTGALTFYLNSKSDMLCRVQPPKKSELDYWLMGKNWQSTIVRADRLSALVGKDAGNVSFIKLDVEGTEAQNMQRHSQKLCKFTTVRSHRSKTTLHQRNA
jgi:FkbM family methyltransferase